MEWITANWAEIGVVIGFVIAAANVVARITPTETDNKVLLFQSYTLDIWIPANGGSRRYNMSWQQTEVGSLNASDIEGVLGAGIETLMADQDEWLSENP